MQRNDVGRLEQLVHFDITHGFAFQLRHLVDVERENVHAQRLAATSERLTNATVADDADGLAVELNSLIGLLFPFAFAHGVACGRDESRTGEHMPQRQFSNRVRACLRRVANGDAAPFGADFVDVIDAHARTDDELEFAGHASGVNLLFAHFGCAAHDEHIVILQGFAKRVRLVKLHVYLTTLRLKRGDCALF